jgi:hypothetical protein
MSHGITFQTVTRFKLKPVNPTFLAPSLAAPSLCSLPEDS